jgi:tRNA threonylcarbamoyladenosine biosynthesis protein TsaE
VTRVSELGTGLGAAATPDELRAFGARLAAALRPGDLVILAGPLGAGKTVLAQGVAAGLGVRTPVTSPTFVLAREYRDGRVPLIHVDAYRLPDRSEVDALGLDSELEESVTLVEWGEGLVETLADGWLRIEIDRRPDTEVRRLRAAWRGAGWAARLATVAPAGAEAG